ncbi:H-NS histone family protein [Cupriavidus sp. IK-TO18]|nr:H-NS histone family protein [Cupriavidus sp. IK-TO18]TDF66974.1 H-NS histone family protein [Cupriavidus sp. L7L]
MLILCGAPLQIEEVRANEGAGVIEKIRTLMAEYDLTVEDITMRRRGRPASCGASKPKSELPPKYRDPKTGKNLVGPRPSLDGKGFTFRELRYVL